MKETADEVDNWPSWLRSQDYKRTTREIRDKITRKASGKWPSTTYQSCRVTCNHSWLVLLPQADRRQSSSTSVCISGSRRGTFFSAALCLAQIQ